jgi:hypothetical protein
MNNDCLDVILQKIKQALEYQRRQTVNENLPDQSDRIIFFSAVVIVRWDTFSQSEGYLENTEKFKFTRCWRLFRYLIAARGVKSTEVRLMQKLCKRYIFILFTLNHKNGTFFTSNHVLYCSYFFICISSGGAKQSQLPNVGRGSERLRNTTLISAAMVWLTRVFTYFSIWPPLNCNSPL